jgi:CBS domain-containing protein
MLEAKDLMTKNVICIKKDIPVIDAIRLMAKNNITGIPVVEDDGVLVGILSEQDVLRLFHTFEDEKDRTVSDFMTQPAIHFEEDELLLDVCYCLRDNSIRRVPVTSKGKVVGVISRSDILKCILKLLDDKDAVSAGGVPNNKKQPVSATTLQSSSLHNTSK